MIWLALIATAVGVLIGAVGVGGVLLIPALTLLAPLSIQGAMATSLFTFIFTGIAGTVLFQRRGSIDWRLAAPLCVPRRHANTQSSGPLGVCRESACSCGRGGCQALIDQGFRSVAG